MPSNLTRFEIHAPDAIADRVFEQLRRIGVARLSVVRAARAADGNQSSGWQTMAPDCFLIVAYGSTDLAARLAEDLLPLLHPYGGAIFASEARELSPAEPATTAHDTGDTK